MEWSNCFSSKRTGKSELDNGPRSEYQRDIDRLVFSSAFRRLQNKTQVFPLPGSAFVHNRLTHSLEVSSVGRSLGKLIGDYIHNEILDGKADKKALEFYKYDLPNVISAACLAHDIGNPAFGHSGEKAISNYFIENKSTKIEGKKKLKDYFDEREWLDITNFEGNANAVRILTNSLKGRNEGGYRLTYTTIGAILKYPCESIAQEGKEGKSKHRSKFGFFQSEKEIIAQIANELNMIKESDDPICYKRHPFVYLVEAADDICYRIIDIEDAHRLGIITCDKVSNAFFNVISCINRKEENLDKIQSTFDQINDNNEKIAFLRSKCINILTLESADIFKQRANEILMGNYYDAIVDEIEKNCGALEKIRIISNKEVYNTDSVVEIEIAGYEVMAGLLNLIIPSLLKNSPNHKDKKILTLFPDQFTRFNEVDSPYLKVMCALDFVSGMTDQFATELYRKLKGIEIPKHK